MIMNICHGNSCNSNYMTDNENTDEILLIFIIAIMPIITTSGTDTDDHDVMTMMITIIIIMIWTKLIIIPLHQYL